MKTLRILRNIVLLMIVVAIGVAVYFLGGFFNVAASQDDPDIVNWALQHVREASIARHATVMPTVSLDGLTAHELSTQLGTVLEQCDRDHAGK